MMPDEARGEFEASRDWWDSMTWRIASETESTLVLLGVDEAEGRYGNVAFEMVDGQWRATGWGDCRIEPVVEGYGTATFELDPTNPPDSASRQISVLATERDCANGEPPEGREVRASVTETGDRFHILVLVEPISGGATCPCNPAFPVVVSLTGPLGDRMIVDGSTSPETEKEWPIPMRSSELNIWLAGDSPAAGTAHVFGWSGPSAGALLVQAANWSEEPTWFQSFVVGEITITGFVVSCDGCAEECEAEQCDQLTRVGSECAADYVAIDGFDTTMTIRYFDTGCTIDVATKPIEI